MYVKAVQFLKQQYLVFLHVLFLLFLFFIYKLSGLHQFNVNTGGLVNFDAYWYSNLKEHGYIFSDKAQSNTGFYPTLSFVWKFTGLSALGISIFNGIIFLFSFLLLSKEFSFNNKEKLLVLSIHSLIFTYVPYTESLFFFASTILLIGLRKQNMFYILIGVLLGSFIRPVTIIFIPSLIFIELLSNKSYLQKLIRISLFSIVSVIALLLVAIIQWLQTGVWLAYYKSQYIQWDRSLHIPRFPLTTWGGPRILWLDGTAFWLGLIAIGLCIFFLFKKESKIKLDDSSLFSFSFLSGATLLVFLFDGYSENGGTSIMGLNRYFFATPFFFLAFLEFLRLPPVSKKRTALLILSLIGVWILFGAYTSIDWYNRTKTIIYFSILTLSVLGYFLILNNKWMLEKRIWILLYIANCMLQAYLFFRFLSGNWVG